MARFFVEKETLSADEILLVGENARHAAVLRLKAGEEVILCDGAGNEALCRVESVQKDALSLSVLSRSESESEARVSVTLYMAFSKSDKFEHVVQKATELGARCIVAFPSARCVSRPDEKSLRNKLSRWEKIAASAAEQSGRGVIPEVRVLPSFAAVLSEVKKTDVPVLCYENEDGFSLSDALREKEPFSTVSLITGPEGGLTEGEVAAARGADVFVCTLGKRILRCETAPLAALSAVLFAAGEF